MTPTEALQSILAQIHSNDSDPLGDLVVGIEMAAEAALEDRPISEGHMTLSFNGFTSSRRGVDAVLKALVLGHAGGVSLTESEIERCRRGYDLRIEGYDGGIRLRAIEKS